MLNTPLLFCLLAIIAVLFKLTVVRLTVTATVKQSVYLSSIYVSLTEFYPRLKKIITIAALIRPTTNTKSYEQNILIHSDLISSHNRNKSQAFRCCFF